MEVLVVCMNRTMDRQVFVATSKRLVTRKFRLDQFDDALSAMTRPDALKVHLQPHLPPKETQ